MTTTQSPLLSLRLRQVAVTRQQKGKEEKMSLSALPLPLELAQPIHLAGDLDSMLRDSLHIGSYDPHMQVGPVGGGSCETNNESSAASNTTGNPRFISLELQLSV